MLFLGHGKGTKGAGGDDINQGSSGQAGVLQGGILHD